MRRISLALLAILLLIVGLSFASAQKKTKSKTIVLYKGVCDGSAAVALKYGLFLAINDEDNRIRVYKPGKAVPVYTGPSLSSSTVLGLKEKNKKKREAEEDRV